VDIAWRLRRLYDMEAAALATAAVLLGRRHPDELAAARVRVASAADTSTSTNGTMYRVPK
jgi:hypothetical protein